MQLAVGVLLLYAAMVGVLHWHVIVSLSTSLLTGPALGGGGEFFPWEFFWAQRFFSGQVDTLSFTKELFFPNGVPVIFQSPVLTAASLPLQWVFNVYATFNLLALLNYPAAGLSMYFLARAMGRRADAAFLAGLVFMFSHYNLTQHMLGQLQEATLAFVPLVFLSLVRLNEKENPFSFAALVLSGIGVIWSSVYLTFEVLAIGAPLFALFLNQKFKKQLVVRLAAAEFIWSVVIVVTYFPLFLNRSDLIGASAPCSLSLMSFIDFPLWHPVAWVQRLRQSTSGFLDTELINTPGFIGNAALTLRATPEKLMGFFSITLLVLTGFAARRVDWKDCRPWLALFIAGAILALGPHLEVAYTRTGIPMPYWILHELGLPLRNPARMIILSWTAVAVIVAIAFDALSGQFQRPMRFLLLAVVAGAFMWEMGVSQIGKYHTTLNIDGVYRHLEEDPSTDGLLELPVAFNKQKDVSINAQKYMLYQPRHRKSLVIASPPRHFQSTLEFAQSVEVVYVLTHPLALQSLYSKPELQPRLEALKQDAKKKLREFNIKYVLFHSEDLFFSPDVLASYEQFLADVFGKPQLQDGIGRKLYQVY